MTFLKFGSKTLSQSIIFMLCSYAVQAQVEMASTFPSESIASIKLSDIFLTPDRVLTMWDVQPVPLALYTKQELELQKEVNKKNSDAVVTFSPPDLKHEWTPIDEEDITPFTWKWVHLTSLKSDSTTSFIKLRRPHWWLKKIGADSVQKKVYVDMPEMGIVGWATVTSIKANQLDTRIWEENRKGDYVNRPITGKFIHESDNVYELYFKNNPQPLGVTANHPIWSADKKMWVAAAGLEIGEHVSTYLGESELVKKVRKPGRHTVYNLEVYRDHNYFVTHQSLFTHNICWAEWSNLLKNAGMNAKRSVTSRYSVQSASESVGETYKIVVYDIKNNNPSYLSQRYAASFSDALEKLIIDAKNSSKPKMEMLIYTPEKPYLEYFQKNINKNFKGLNVEFSQGAGDISQSIHITGDIDKIVRIRK